MNAFRTEPARALRMTNLDALCTLLDLARSQGGFTVDPDTLEPVTLSGGFMVSSAAGETRLPSDVDVLDLSMAIRGVRDLLDRAAGNGIDTSGWYLGGWIDDDGLLCVDASQHIRGLERAIATGRARDQDSIYRLTDGQVLPLR
jgi:hypothetical protein